MMRWVVGLTVLAALGGGGYWYWGKSAEGAGNGGDDKGSFEVKRGNLVITLTERGTLKTRKSTEIRPEIRGNAKIEWIIEEGSTVEAGQVLVELDRTEITRQVEELEGRVIQLESESKAADTDLVIQEEQNKTDIEKAELALEVAQVTLQKLEEGDIPQELRTHRIRIEKAESDVKRAEYKFDAMPELKEKGFVTEDQYEQERIALETARTELESARLALRLYENYQQPLDLKQKRSAVTEAQRNVERARKQAEAYVDSKRAQAGNKAVSLKSSRDRLALLRTSLEKMTLKAPQPGTVVYGDPDREWMAEEVKVGADVWSNLVLITLPDPSQLAVAIEVHEAEIDKLAVGMTAHITSDTQKGTVYEGSVLKIASVANAGQRWGGDIKKFRVEVSLNQENANLKPGTSASVEVQIGCVEGVLFVPVQAVHAREGVFFCYVQRGGQSEKVTVELGSSNEAYVEVKQGLAEGDRVLLYEPEADRVAGAANDAAAGAATPGAGGAAPKP
ncbi:MAG: efflux RND transporter periplasmic adaptor subunit [Planctomycetota bacterium]